SLELSAVAFCQGVHYRQQMEHSQKGRWRSPALIFGLAVTRHHPNEAMGATVSVLLRSRGLGRSSVQSRDSETRRLAICIAGGRASSNNLAFLPRQHDGSMTGSLQLRDYPGDIVRLSCAKCGRPKILPPATKEKSA